LPAQSIEQVTPNTPFSLSIVYTRPTSYVSGRVFDASTMIGMPGVPVQIVDPAANNRTLSTVQQTGDGTGHQPTGSFSLWLSPGVPDDYPWSLQMVSQPTAPIDPTIATGRLVYQVTRAALGAATNYTGLALRADSMLSLTGSVSGTCLACVDLDASIEGTNAAGLREVIAGATVSLRADDVLGSLPTGQTAWFEGQATTTQDGSFHARLMPGTYTAVITPPRDSPYAITSAHLELSHTLRGQVLNVHQLVPVIGMVASSTHGEQGVAGAQIEAVPLVDPNAAVNPSMPVTQFARHWQVYADADGTFLLPLDEGSFLFVVHPPDGSGLATQLFPGPAVVFNPRDANTDPSAIPLSLNTLVLGAPISVRGTVFDSSGRTTLGNAAVRSFARCRNSGGLALDIELARTLSDTNGGYSVLLPSSILCE
jgi:hypothetical protein